MQSLTKFETAVKNLIPAFIINYSWLFKILNDLFKFCDHTKVVTERGNRLSRLDGSSYNVETLFLYIHKYTSLPMANNKLCFCSKNSTFGLSLVLGNNQEFFSVAIWISAPIFMKIKSDEAFRLNKAAHGRFSRFNFWF